MTWKHKLETALAIIGPHPLARAEALAVTRRAVETELQRQLETGIWYLTPSTARRWHCQRRDGITVEIPDGGGSYLL